MDQRMIVRLGGVMGFLAVALGAFGAHGLKSILETNQTLPQWETASLYHLIHALAMLLPWSMSQQKWKPALFFCAGTVVFSGSLYLLALTNLRWLGMVTPIGGILFLIGWAILVVNPSMKPNKTGPSELSHGLK